MNVSGQRRLISSLSTSKKNRPMTYCNKFRCRNITPARHHSSYLIINPLPNFDYWEPAHHTTTNDEQQVTLSWSHEPSVKCVGTIIDGENGASEMNLQRYTYEQPVVTTRTPTTTKEYNATDIERSQVDVVVSPAVIQTPSFGTSKPQGFVDDVVDLPGSRAQTQTNLDVSTQTTRNPNVTASATGIQTSKTVEYVLSKLDNCNQEERVDLAAVEWEQKRTTQTTSSWVIPPLSLKHVTDGRLPTFSETEGGSLGYCDLDRHSTLRGSKAKGISTRSGRSSSPHSEWAVWNAGKPNETAFQSDAEQGKVTGDIADSEQTSQDQDVKTALEKSLAAAALVWAESDITDSRLTSSKDTSSSRLLTDVGTSGVVDTLGATGSTQDASGDSSRSVLVSDEKCCRSPTPKQTNSESLRESSSQSATDTHNADGFHFIADDSFNPRPYCSKATSVHDDMNVSSDHKMQQELSPSERSASHQDIRVDVRAGWLVGEDEDDDKGDLVFDPTKENSTMSFPLSTSQISQLIVVFDSWAIQPSLTQTEGDEEKRSHSWGGQTFDIPGIVDRYPSSPDASTVDSEMHELQLFAGDLSITNRSSTASKDSYCQRGQLTDTSLVYNIAPTKKNKSQNFRENMEHRLNLRQSSYLTLDSEALFQLIRCMHCSRSLNKSEAHFSTNQLTEVVSRASSPDSTTNCGDDTFHAETLDAASVVAPRDLAGTMMKVHSHGYTSHQETMDNDLRLSAFESNSVACTTIATGQTVEFSQHRVVDDVDGHRSPSLDYMEESSKESIDVDLYDIAERGVVYRSLSRPFFIRTRSMQYWMSLSDDTEQETTEVSEDPPEGAGSVVICYQYAPYSGTDQVLDETLESTLALARLIIDYMCRRRDGHPSFEVGVTLCSLETCPSQTEQHIVIDHRLFVDDHHDLPGAIVRTGPSATERRPIVIMIAKASGRSFDDDELVAAILSCIDVGLDAPQDLGLLCCGPPKNEENGSVSIDELDMGYWIKVTVTKLILRERRAKDDEVPHVVEVVHDQDHGGEGIVEDVSFTEKVDVDMMYQPAVARKGWFVFQGEWVVAKVTFRFEVSGGEGFNRGTTT
ncbi:hypothetical protein J3R83DRAFT_9188 [Lanmaoa asiatica]|nr:hypothetical protein J3R83DRAFT_9188 [Lanmaoa asiatica]